MKRLLHLNSILSIGILCSQAQMNVNALFDAFQSILSQVEVKHVPIRLLTKKSIKQLSKPWITSGIRTSIKTKNKLFHQYIRTQ